MDEEILRYQNPSSPTAKLATLIFAPLYLHFTLRLVTADEDRGFFVLLPYLCIQ